MTGTSPESAYLDAARECIVDVGWRRTTLTDIARRAGVSRMTIYRRWPDMQTLFADLLVREWSELLVEAELVDDDRASTRTQIASGLTRMVRLLRDNALWRRIVELDPELLQPYLLHRTGRNQKWAIDVLATLLKDGQADGSVRAGDPNDLARAILLAAYGFVLSAHTMETPLDTLDEQLTDLIERYLQP